MRVSEIRVKRICVNQGLGVIPSINAEKSNKCIEIENLIGFMCKQN